MSSLMGRLSHMKLLTFTTLYPNELQKRHGIFVKNRMVHIAALEDVDFSVIAPVADVPFLKYFKQSRYFLNSQIKPSEIQDKIRVSHPKYFSIPKITNIVKSLFKSAVKEVEENAPDIIDGQYLYPDGIAAYHLAKSVSRPLVLTARGSDVNYWMEIPRKKQEILEAINYASKVICVSGALQKSLINHGVNPEKLALIYNGIDHEVFNAKNRKKTPDYFIAVGNLVPLKGQSYILEALAKFPEEKLKIIGTGEDEALLKNLAHKLGITSRVEFIPYLNQRRLCEYYAGAKALILMSEREGMPNVVLESFACGCPVIAANVGGIAEVVNEKNGILLEKRDSSALVLAIEKLLSSVYDVNTITKTVAHMDWEKGAKEQYDVYNQAIKSFKIK